jgi:SAM-dependent methyltransferase
MRERIAAVPVLGPALRMIHQTYEGRKFRNSSTYWEQRYFSGGNSGAGSYGRLAMAKADFVNRLVEERGIKTVLELGCGDGNQLVLARYPSYVGVDISTIAVEACRARFAGDTSKRFLVTGSEPLPICELGLSLDVIYHLVEDDVFERYMHDLLTHSSKLVVLYTSDSDVTPPSPAPHVRHRAVARWMASRSDWRFKERLQNPYPFQEGHEDTTSFADFYVYEKVHS